MNIETLHIGMKVRHPQYGVGTVRSLTEQTAEIAFDDAPRTIAPASSDLQPAEATATLSELEMPLANLIRDTYVTRCYGSLTTFNILFKNKDDQFRTSAVDRPTG